MSETKLIWHFDLDSFFVSAERLRYPHLRNRPVAVGGDGVRGVVASCSYEARRFGVRSAMPTFKAVKLCPTLVLCPVDISYYGALSEKVFSLFDRFTPLYEQVSVDEAYLDMTGSESLFGPPLTAANKFRELILKETGLTSSIGIASNRLVAKIATDLCKPNNAIHVLPGREATTLAPLPVGRLPGCGSVTQKWLADRDIKTIAELQSYPLDVLESHLGRFGLYLHEAAWGRGSVEFHEEAKTKSISRETTFEEDCFDSAELKKVLWDMSTDLGRSLRQDGVFAKTMRLKLRYPPFQTVSRSRVLHAPTQSDKELYSAIETLFTENWNKESPLRLIGMGCVIGESEKQLGLFEFAEGKIRNNELDVLRDKIQMKFGEKALRTGRDLSKK